MLKHVAAFAPNCTNIASNSGCDSELDGTRSNFDRVSDLRHVNCQHFTLAMGLINKDRDETSLIPMGSLACCSSNITATATDTDATVVSQP